MSAPFATSSQGIRVTSCAARYGRAPTSPAASSATPAQCARPSSTGCPCRPRYEAARRACGSAAPLTRRTAAAVIPGHQQYRGRRRPGRRQRGESGAQRGAHTVGPVRVVHDDRAGQVGPPPYLVRGRAEHHHDRVAAAGPQDLRRVLDEQPAGPLDERLGHPVPPPAARGEQQPRAAPRRLLGRRRPPGPDRLLGRDLGRRHPRRGVHASKIRRLRGRLRGAHATDHSERR